MVNHQPASVSKNKKVGCCGERRIETGFVEDGDVFCAGHPRKILIHMNPNIRRRGPQFLTALKNHLPTVTHATPSGKQIPSGMDAAHPVFVCPNVIHSFEHTGFKRAIERRISLFDRDSVFDAHRGPRLYRSTSRIQVAYIARVRACVKVPAFSRLLKAEPRTSCFYSLVQPVFPSFGGGSVTSFRCGHRNATHL